MKNPKTHSKLEVNLANMLAEGLSSIFGVWARYEMICINRQRRMEYLDNLMIESTLNDYYNLRCDSLRIYEDIVSVMQKSLEKSRQDLVVDNNRNERIERIITSLAKRPSDALLNTAGFFLE